MVAAMVAAMAMLAALPSISVMTVVARSASFGFGFVHGAATSLGIVTGDLVFVVIAITGLSVLTEALGGPFSLGEVPGGVSTWSGWGRRCFGRSDPFNRLRQRQGRRMGQASWPACSLLADQKAILFYLAFFPAFVDLPALTPMDCVAIAGVSCLCVDGVNRVYAAGGTRGRQDVGRTHPARHGCGDWRHNVDRGPDGRHECRIRA